MPTLRELKNRLRGVKTTGQLAGAMRTVATAKYSRANEMLKKCSEHSAAARELAAIAERGERGKKPRSRKGIEPETKAPELLVLVSSNRGLCGGYNHELFGFFSEELSKCAEPPLVIACGRMAQDYCRERGIELMDAAQIDDVPTSEQARALSERLTGCFDRGEVSSVSFICQRFVNMMKQVPERRRFLPLTAGEAAAEGPEPVFIPDRRTVAEGLRTMTLAADVYSILLSCASGAQAATLMAMRSAYDNAKASEQLLETAINRRRQAKVTEGVIETSADADNFSF